MRIHIQEEIDHPDQILMRLLIGNAPTGIEIGALNQAPFCLVPASSTVPAVFLKRSLMPRMRR